MSTAVGRDWVGRVVNGDYPLLEWLGGSDGTGLFVTGLGASQKAVIRLFQEGSVGHVAHGDLAHPHLAAVLASGEAKVNGDQVNYVVTEYAEEVLSQILPERALSADETREMLAPVLDALGYLHGKGLVHGHLKPAHILVIRENLKLSSDQIEVAGQPRLHAMEPEIYDAPEYGKGAVSPAHDMWSLGMTLVETLTQRLPEWDRTRGGNPVLPESLPPPFAEIARRCLEPDPAKRCTVDDVKALLDGKTVALRMPVAPPSTPASQPSVVSPPPSPPAATTRPAASPPPIAPPRPGWKPPEESHKRWLMPVVAIVVVLLAIIVVLQARSCGSKKTEQVQQQAPSGDSQQSPASSPTPAAPDVQQGPSVKGSVAKRVMPDVSEGASQTIHGTVKVVVRATVDANGQVSGTEFQSAGPSKYFARVAQEAARGWKFKPAQANGHGVSSVWLLRFEFRRDGNDASATEQTP